MKGECSSFFGTRLDCSQCVHDIKPQDSGKCGDERSYESKRARLYGGQHVPTVSLLQLQRSCSGDQKQGRSSRSCCTFGDIVDNASSTCSEKLKTEVLRPRSKPRRVRLLLPRATILEGTTAWPSFIDCLLTSTQLGQLFAQDYTRSSRVDEWQRGLAILSALVVHSLRLVDGEVCEWCGAIRCRRCFCAGA